MNADTQNLDAAEPPATHFSRTAVLSAMFALPVCCPPMSLLACITGGVALWQIRRNPLARGAWLAIAAMVIGAASAIVMSTLLWNNGLGLLWRGPGAPMDAVMRGDTAAMRQHWSGPAGDPAAGARRGSGHHGVPCRLHRLGVSAHRRSGQYDLVGATAWGRRAVTIRR